MRRALFVIATASIAVAVLAGGALAKGVTGTATVEGEGLDKAITFNGDTHEDDGFMTFVGQTGVFDYSSGAPSSDRKDQPPTTDLGPRYTITWDIEQFEGPNVHLVQYLYPYAEGGPVVFTPQTGARIMGTAVPQGWWEAPIVLRSHLESRGLPEEVPEASAAAGASGATQAAETSSTLPYVLLIIVVTSLVAIGLVAARHRPRTAKAS
jgi:hypothetical protein